MAADRWRRSPNVQSGSTRSFHDFYRAVGVRTCSLRNIICQMCRKTNNEACNIICNCPFVDHEAHHTTKNILPMFKAACIRVQHWNEVLTLTHGIVYTLAVAAPHLINGTLDLTTPHHTSLQHSSHQITIGAHIQLPFKPKGSCRVWVFVVSRCLTQKSLLVEQGDSLWFMHVA